jgi:hypothetical protein
MPSFPPNPNSRRPNAAEIFTDRKEQQAILREVLSPNITSPVDPSTLLTQFYGIGGVGKTALCKRARKIAEEFPRNVRTAATSFEANYWNPDSPFTEVAAELCRCCWSKTFDPISLWDC